VNDFMACFLLYAAAPLKPRNGTGAPVNPLVIR
jgi:hypothetical protein